MPIYEYQCNSCKTNFQRLILRGEEEAVLSCPKCGAAQPRKLISRVAYHVSERSRLGAYDPKSSKGDSFYKDSRNIGLDAKMRAQRMGVDLGSGFEEKLEKLRTDPGSVLKDGD
jgi:putative FmdB family regulatory protein